MSGRRVLQLVGPSAGGIRRHVRHLGHHLREQGWAVEVAAPAGVLDDVDHVLPALRPRHPGGVAQARRVLRAAMADVDLVHAHGLTVGWLAASIRRRPPLVVSVHNLVLDEVAGPSAPLLRWLEHRLPGRADATIAISAGVAERFRAAPGAERIRVVPPTGPLPAPDRTPDQVRAELGVADGEDLVVTAARLSPQKGLDVLLEAADVARRHRPGLRWFVFGEGAQRATLERTIAERRLTGTVVLAGPRPGVDAELAAADVVVVTSTWESGPLVVLEALALGRPVVSTDVGLARDVLDGRSGRVVPVGDAGALAAAVVAVLEGAGPAPAPVRPDLAPDALAAAVARVYDEVLGGSDAAPGAPTVDP